MKVVIAGSRCYGNMRLVGLAVNATGWQVTTVISGAARGADRAGELWAEVCRVPVISKPADWNAWGKRAGYIRNAEMASIADAVVVVWDGISRGSKSMIEIALARGLPVAVFVVPQGVVHVREKDGRTRSVTVDMNSAVP